MHNMPLRRREQGAGPGGATLLMHLNFLLPPGAAAVAAAAEETADTNYFQFVICGYGCWLQSWRRALLGVKDSLFRAVPFFARLR